MLWLGLILVSQDFDPVDVGFVGMLSYQTVEEDPVMHAFIVLFTCDSCFCTIIMIVNGLVGTNVRRLFFTFRLAP